MDLASRREYLFPAIRPVMPPPSRWAIHLAPSYEARWYSNFGPASVKFENALAEKFCAPGEGMTLTASCTAGIAGALIALGVTGKVIIPAFTFPATLSAVVMAGARPCVLDVDPAAWIIPSNALEQALATGEYGAVVMVAPFGIRRDFTRHCEACARHGAALVIDNASGLDPAAPPLHAGRCMEVYSMHATKPFAIGEGGAVRAHRAHAEALRRALNFGLLRGSGSGSWGINGKMSEFSAAVGLAVLEDYDATLAARRNGVSRYIEAFRGRPLFGFAEDVRLAPWQAFPVLFPSEATLCEFIDRCAGAGLEIRRSYRPTLDGWPGATAAAPCPVARSLSDRMACIPVYSDSTEGEISSIVRIVGASLLGITPNPA